MQELDNRKKSALIIGTPNFGSGGVTVFWGNVARFGGLHAIDGEYIVLGNISGEYGESMLEEFDAAGVTVIPWGLHWTNLSFCMKICNYWRCIRKMSIMCRSRRYDILYVNTDSIPLQTIFLFMGRMRSIPKRVSHSHNTGRKVGVLWTIFRKSIVRNATDLLACSLSAAEDLFGKEAGQRATILKYGIDTKQFAFSAPVREVCRKELGFAGDDYVIGHVGRFVEQKNHRFLIDVFYDVSKICPEARLLMLGEGELQEEIRQRVCQYGLEDKVIFAGAKEQMERYYCAMDVFVLPSLYEGLGIVNLEAQASGLSCIVSDQVPREADVSGRVKFLPLGDASVWRVSLLKHKGLAHDRESDWREVYDAGYDVEKTAQTLTELFDRK